MPTFDNGESGFSVRTKINAAIEKVDGTAPITAIDVNGGSIDGAIIGANAPVAVIATNLIANTDLTIASSTTVTAILDEDDLVSDSATALATQQSIKAYVDGQVGDVNELSEILANGNTSGANDIIINASQKITVDTIDETTADGGVTIDSVLLKDNVVNATDIEASSISANDGTEAATIADSTGVITVPSSVLTTADINGGTADNVIIGGTTPSAATVTNLTANTDLTIAGTVTITSVLDEDNMASNDPAGLATQQSIKAYVDAQVGANNELSEVLANGNTTGGSDIIVSSGDVITTNTINETTSASGVTIDGILLKDGDITLSGSVDGRDIAADGTKLDGIEASADVTDTANVTAAGALMDSEITNLDQVKAFDSADYATAAQGTTADAALPKAGGAMTGAITTNSTFDGRNVSADGTKLDFITVTQAVDLDQMEIDIAALANGMVYKGDWDASSGSFPGAGSAQIGWFYYVSVAGTVDSVSFDVGDNIVATTDNASSTTFAGNWSKHDQTDAVQSVVGLTGSIAKSSLLAALNVEDGADVTDTANVTAAGALMTTGGTMSGDLTFGDDDKIIMGAGSDLQLYHDGSHSYVQDVGTGNLFIASDANVNITNQATSELKATFISNGAVNLYYDNSLKLATKASGIDIKFDGGGSQMGLDIHNQGTATDDDAAIIFETQGSRNFAMGIDRSALSFVIAESSTLTSNPRIVINDDGKVGIGTDSALQRLHVFNASSGVSVASSNSDLIVENSGNSGISILTPAASNGQILFGDPEDNDVGRIQYNHPSDYMAFYTAGIEQVRITNDGNIKILTSNSGTITGIGSDSRKNMVVGSTTGGEIVAYRQDNAVAGGEFIGALLFGHDDNTGTEDHFAGMWAKATSSAGVMDIHFAGGISNYETDTPQMTLKSNGQFLVGTTVISYGGRITSYQDAGASSAAVACINNVTSGSVRLVDFFRGTSTTRIGYISANGSNVVTYNTGSDYRLKTDVQPITGASERVQALNPVNFEWIVSGERTDGFIAHEAATVVPEAVTGEKDAVDADGNPDYQGIDQSKIVPLLTAALQEALTKIDSLEARIAALEA